MMANNGVRKRIVYFSLPVVFLLIAVTLSERNIPFAEFPDDYFAYWSAGHLLNEGENPYSRLNSMQLSKELGFKEMGFFLSYFYPPWTLPLFLPLGAISYPVSRLIWLVISIATLMIAARWIWQLNDGPRNKGWIPLMCVLTLSPALFALMEGQVTPFILLGITGFIFFEKRQKWFVAGCFLALATFKLHVLYLFWIALVIWVVRLKRWGIIFGLISFLAAMTILIMIVDRSIWVEYMRMNSYQLPRYCNNPTLSAILCLVSGKWKSWQLLIAPAFGCAWFIYFWQKEKRAWNWQEKLPLLIFACLITAPYTWMHDGLLFLIAVIGTVVWFIYCGFSKRVCVVVTMYLLTNLIVFALLFEFRIEQTIFIWLPVIFLILYLLSGPKSSRKFNAISGERGQIGRDLTV